jgi:hypothetical protein
VFPIVTVFVLPKPTPLYLAIMRPSSPSAVNLARQQAERGNSNYHSTSLRNVLTKSVNKTALHPSGVE